MSSLMATLLAAGLTVPAPEAHRLPPFSSVVEAIAAIDAEGPAGLDSDRLRDDLRWFAVQRRALEAAEARWLAELDRRDDDEHHESSTRFLQDNLQLTPNAAFAQVRTARQLDELPRTAAALRGGVIGAPQVQVICRAMGQVPKTRLDPDGTEAKLVDAAMGMDSFNLQRYWQQLRVRHEVAHTPVGTHRIT